VRDSGSTALEALACGLPVVTVDHPANAIRDLITEKTGFCVRYLLKILRGVIREALRRHADMRQIVPLLHRVRLGSHCSGD